jgi:hypothetical protein
VIDRMAAKVGEGIEIGNAGAYAVQVLRFVLLELHRRNKEDAAGDDLPEVAFDPVLEMDEDPDLRLQALRKCLAEIVTDEKDRQLIVGYYDLKEGEKNSENRRQLAERLGLSPTNLKVKACRLRNRLEECINECISELV